MRASPGQAEEGERERERENEEDKEGAQGGEPTQPNRREEAPGPRER